MLLDGVRGPLRLSLEQQRDEAGFNLAALRFILKQIDEDQRSDFIDDMPEQENIRFGRKKRGFIDIA